MRKLLLFIFTACLSASAVAQEKFELGKPNDDNYRYLDDYLALKEYINYTDYPNFKLGSGTTVSDYLNNSLFKNLINNELRRQCSVTPVQLRHLQLRERGL